MPKELHLLSKRRRNQLIQQKLTEIQQSANEQHLLPSIETTGLCSTGTALDIPCNDSVLDYDERQNLFDQNADLNIPAFSNSDDTSDDMFSSGQKTEALVESQVGQSCDESQHSKMFSKDTVNDEKLKEELADLVIECNVPHVFVNKLLQLLQRHGHNLPSDVRTLVKTPKATTTNCVSSLSGGKYAHLGFCSGISQSVKKYFCNIPSIVRVNINIDGLPLAKSSTKQFWPLLGSIVADDYTEPFLIGVFYGTKKPEDANEYLQPFVDECLSLTNNEFLIEVVKVKIMLNAIICDAPAKAFICGIKSHTGYFGCSKCTQEGDFVQNRVVFPEVNSPLRTDAAFKSRLQPEHHVRDCCLDKLDIGMVSQVPLDYMHLVCLGVMKRLLQFWVKGRMNVRLKEIDQISGIFVEMKCSITEEFVRLPRSLFEIDHWKATEFRQFLLYTGPVLLRQKLPPIYYEHFLSLSIAIRILVDSKLSKSLIEYADSLLVWFVKCFGDLYGIEFVSYNVHNLVHLSADVKTFGPLDSFSAFKYENYMQKIKHKLQNSGNYLQQLVNRIYEENRLVKKYEPPRDYPIVKYSKKNEEIIRSVQFCGFSISNSKYNNCVMLDDCVFGLVDYISMCDHKCVVHIQRFTNVQPFFNVPCDSRKIGIGVININLGEQVTVSIEEIKRKCIMLDYSNHEYVVLPLLHSEI